MQKMKAQLKLSIKAQKIRKEKTFDKRKLQKGERIGEIFQKCGIPYNTCR